MKTFIVAAVLLFTRRSSRVHFVTVVIAITGISYAGSALATSIPEIELNDSLSTAQNVDAFFSRDFDPNIGTASTLANTSTTIPHVTIRGEGDGIGPVVDNITIDFFSFTVSTPGSLGMFDIDFGSGLDTRLTLFNSLGSSLAFNDDNGGGDAGSNPRSSHDSFINFIFVNAGSYAIKVSHVAGTQSPGATYLLQISVENHTVAEPASSALLGFGLIAFGFYRRFVLHKEPKGVKSTFSS